MYAFVIVRDMDDFYVPFGRMINFQTRKGKFELLSDIFEEAKERAHEGLARFLSKLEISTYVCI
jgi:arginyl-tRNA synthetase